MSSSTHSDWEAKRGDDGEEGARGEWEVAWRSSSFDEQARWSIGGSRWSLVGKEVLIGGARDENKEEFFEMIVENERE